MGEVDGWWKFTVLLPWAWRKELKEAAKANGISAADLVRMAVRSFLSARYGPRNEGPAQ